MGKRQLRFGAKRRTLFPACACVLYKNDRKEPRAATATTAAKFTAAHRTLPFGTRLIVTDPKSRRSVTVTVNDQGPFTKGRVLDLSYAAAGVLRRMIAASCVSPPLSISSWTKPPSRTCTHPTGGHWAHRLLGYK